MSDETTPRTAATAGSPSATGSAAVDDAPGPAVRLLHLASLAGLAVAAPLLELLARHAEFLVAHRLGPWDVLRLVAIVMLLPALSLGAVELVAGRLSRRLAGGLHLVFVACLVALVCLPICIRSGLRGVPALAAAALVGAACAWAYRRRHAVRLLVSFLGIVLVGVPGSFFLQPKIQSIFSTPVEIADAPRVNTETPIVMVIFDELAMWALVDPDGAINRHRYPNLAALAERSVWFPNAETVAYSTERAVPALVTGRMPTFEQMPSATDYPENLFTLFAGSHRIWAVEPITALCPQDVNRLYARSGREQTPTAVVLADLGVVYLHVVLPPPFRRGLPPIDMGWRDFRQQAGKLPFESWQEFHRQTRSEVKDSEGRQESVETFLGLLDDDADGEPPLHFLHVLLPHRPLEFLPTGQRTSAGLSTRTPEGLEGLRDEIRDLQFTFEGKRQSQQRYFLQMGYIDHMVGEVVRRLEDTGRFDETMIVLAADHGISLRLGGSARSLTDGAEPADILPVPLLIKKPFQAAGEVVERRVRTVDVLPTILDVLGVEEPWDFDGRSALADGPPRGPLRVETHDGFLEFGDEIHRGKLERSREMIELFGSGEDALDLHRVGPYAHLVGQRTRHRRRQFPGEPWTVAIVESERYRNVAAGAPELPVLVQGTLRADEDEVGDGRCCNLAIAVDDVVQTTFSTAPEPGEFGRVFSALLPPSSLSPGPHRFEIFTIVDSGRSLSLLPLRIEAAEVEVVVGDP